MYRSTSSFVLPLIVSSLLGLVPDAARSQPVQSRTGRIDMRVLGAGDNVRFFIDGKEVAPRERTASWHAAEALAEVPAGEHTVEAQFLSAAGTGIWNRLLTREAVLVTPGSVTQLDADVSKAASGATGDGVRYFRVKTTGAGSSTASASPQLAPIATQAAAAAVNDGVSEPKFSTAAVGAAAVPTIAIVGNNVISDGKTTAAATTAGATTAGATTAGTITAAATTAAATTAAATTAAATTAAAPDPLAEAVAEGLVDDTPAVAELPAPPEQVALVQSGRLEVSFLVQSVPPGADASLDGKPVGKTPLHVKFDPRVDHLLSIARTGCESIVQLLATDAWRTGRSPQALVRLDCK